MKLVTYGYRGERRAGIVEGDWVIDVARAHAQRAGDGPAAERAAAALVPPDARGIIEGGAATRAALDAVSTDFGQDVAAWVASGRAAPLAEVRLLPPVPDPQKIICLGRNYRAHAEEAGGEVPAAPELFVKFANTLVGHEWPSATPTSARRPWPSCATWASKLAFRMEPPGVSKDDARASMELFAEQVVPRFSEGRTR